MEGIPFLVIVCLVCSVGTNIILGLILHSKSGDDRLGRLNERLSYALMAKSLEDYAMRKIVLDEDAGDRFDRIIKENEGIEAAVKKMNEEGIPVT